MAKITSQLNKKLPCVEKAEKMPRVGDWVFALGHGGGLDRKRGPMVRLGRVVSLKNGVIQTDCKSRKGINQFAPVIPAALFSTWMES